ncbi:TPA: hypothetical protein N0F65_005954 [Lagenidium giganteum]|uniref:Tyrosine specific protein phosphatases domain-containing protein n=1 Tax=Lagenidium giganteum TaxID=4803 RepID=A0AAV2ZBE6_9STRA|nr:TPA: hypothetical protein N0F65_005954 [Lagenidium giganteum]
MNRHRDDRDDSRGRRNSPDRSNRRSERRRSPSRTRSRSRSGSRNRRRRRADSREDSRYGPARRSPSPRHSRSRSRSRSRGRERGGRRERRRRRVGLGRHRRGSRATRVPDNWTDVPKIGSLVASSRFVPMRVPLSEPFLAQLRASEHWSPALFMAEQETQALNVRLLIDLTNTTKYYDGASFFADTPIQYVKLSIEGFQGPPREHDVERFIKIVDDFTTANTDGNIAVHCTHGLNRTGYLVVSYLVKRCALTVGAALAAFAAARPPGLIKHMYVQELYRLLGPSEEVQLPELPTWAAAKYGKRADTPVPCSQEAKHREQQEPTESAVNVAVTEAE